MAYYDGVDGLDAEQRGEAPDVHGSSGSAHVQYYCAGTDMVVRRKHTAWSYWNTAAGKWYGCHDAKYYTKRPISTQEAASIIEATTPHGSGVK